MSKSTTTPLRVVRKVWARVPSIPIEDIAEAPSRANENSVPLNPLEQLHDTIEFIVTFDLILDARVRRSFVHTKVGGNWESTGLGRGDFPEGV